MGMLTLTMASLFLSLLLSAVVVRGQMGATYMQSAIYDNDGCFGTPEYIISQNLLGVPCQAPVSNCNNQFYRKYGVASAIITCIDAPTVPSGWIEFVTGCGTPGPNVIAFPESSQCVNSSITAEFFHVQCGAFPTYQYCVGCGGCSDARVKPFDSGKCTNELEITCP